MAGRPRTRAKQEAAARAAFGGPHSNVTPLPSVEAQRLRAHHARAHVHAREPLRSMPLGPRTKELVDETQSERARDLAAYLQPETSVRIERLSPSWAAGIVEDATIQEGEGPAELIEYIRSEHGGQRYKISVLSTDGHVLFVHSLPIPGPPKQCGRLVPRSRWSGDDSDDDARRANPAPASNGLSVADITGLVSALAGATRGDNADARRADALERELRALREELRGALSSRTTNGGNAGGLGAQLAELTGTMRSLGKFKRALADATIDGERSPRENGDAGDDDEPLLDGAVKSAAKELIKHAVVQQFTAGKQQAQPAQQQRAPQQQQRPAQARRVMRRAEPDE